MIPKKIVRALGQEADNTYSNQTRKSPGLAIFVTLGRHFADIGDDDFISLYFRMEKAFRARKSRRQKSGRSFQSLLFFTAPPRVSL